MWLYGWPWGHDPAGGWHLPSRPAMGPQGRQRLQHRMPPMRALGGDPHPCRAPAPVWRTDLRQAQERRAWAEFGARLPRAAVAEG
eukprot:15478005-Alexandrium_andersonii.AAC.1